MTCDLATKGNNQCCLRAGRVQKMDETLQQLRGGDLKLRVRALELERAARRSSILQVAHNPWLLLPSPDADLFCATLTMRHLLQVSVGLL